LEEKITKTACIWHTGFLNISVMALAICFKRFLATPAHLISPATKKDLRTTRAPRLFATSFSCWTTTDTQKKSLYNLIPPRLAPDLRHYYTTALLLSWGGNREDKNAREAEYWNQDWLFPMEEKDLEM